MAAIMRTVTFKNINDGSIYTYPHLNDTLLNYKDYYISKLLKHLKLTNDFCDVNIVYIDDNETGEDILNKFLNKTNCDIDTLLYQYFRKSRKDNLYFYIRINNNTNNSICFSGECIVCYNISNSLRVYYNCSITNNGNIHGLCEDCYENIKKTQYNVCPMCRSTPLN